MNHYKLQNQCLAHWFIYSLEFFVKFDNLSKTAVYYLNILNITELLKMVITSMKMKSYIMIYYIWQRISVKCVNKCVHLNSYPLTDNIIGVEELTEFENSVSCLFDFGFVLLAIL